MPPVFSHTRLSAFEQCPLKFKFAYKDHIKRTEDSIEAFMGKRFHEVLETAYAERAFRERSLDDLKADLNERWDKNFGEHVFVTRPDRTAEDYRRIALKALEDYHRRYAPFADDRCLATEKKIIAELDGGGEYRITGFIDRLTEPNDGHFEIHDYKTSGTLPDQEHLDSDRQLALYEIAVRQLWPEQVKTVDYVWHYVVFDKEMRSRRTSEQLDALKTDTIYLIDRIESATEYPPHESNLCRWCDFQNICPLFAHEFKTADLPRKEFLADDGVALVNELSALDAKKRELKAGVAAIEEVEEDLIKSAIDLAGRQGVSRFVGSDRELTIKDEIEVEYPESKTADRKAFEEGLKKAGLWEQVSGFVFQKFSSLARKKWTREGIPGPVVPFVKLEPVKKARLSRRKDEEVVM